MRRKRTFWKQGVLLVCMLLMPLSFNAQQSLWVGQSYKFDVSSSVLGLTANMSWSTSGGYLSLSGSGFYRNITVTKYFSGTAYVTCEWDYKLTSSGSYTHTKRQIAITCRDNQVSISPASMSLTPGQTRYVSYSHQYSNDYTSAAQAYFQSSNPLVATVNASTGEITAVSSGTTYINVYSKISSVAPYCLVTVKDVSPTSVSIPSSISMVAESVTRTLVPTLTPSNASTTYSWSSSDSNIASVSSSGTISAKNPGKATITVTTANGLKSACDVTVSEPDFKITSTTPVDGMSNVSLFQNMEINFSTKPYSGEQYDNISLTASNEKVNGETRIDGNTMFFIPSCALQPNTNYILSIPSNALKNQWGTNLETTKNISFTTGNREKLSIETNVKGGIVEKGQKISLSASNSNAIIYYTTDNSTPSVLSSVYTEPITIDKTTTIKAYATKDGYTDSEIIKATYIIATGDATISTAYLSVGNIDIDSSEDALLNVSLNNPDDEISFIQFDLYLPDNISMKQVNGKYTFETTDRVPVDGRIIDAESQKDGGVRIILASYTNLSIQGTSAPVVEIPIEFVEGNYDDFVYISNITLVTPQEKAIFPSTNYATISVDCSSDIKNVSTKDLLSLYINDGSICMLSPIDTNVSVYSVNGILMAKVSLQAGVKTYLKLPQGIYLINRKKIKL